MYSSEIIKGAIVEPIPTNASTLTHKPYDGTFNSVSHLKHYSPVSN